MCLKKKVCHEKYDIHLHGAQTVELQLCEIAYIQEIRGTRKGKQDKVGSLLCFLSYVMNKKKRCKNVCFKMLQILLTDRGYTEAIRSSFLGKSVVKLCVNLALKYNNKNRSRE